jgi:two-component system sensor kinase FixL
MPMIGGHIVQIQLFNLVRNAGEAMSAAEAQELTLMTDGALESGATGILITDTGNGVPFELAGRDVRAVHHQQVSRTCLGLAINRTTLKTHGGSIGRKQNPGGGAIFAFSLPAAERRIAWAS